MKLSSRPRRKPCVGAQVQNSMAAANATAPARRVAAESFMSPSPPSVSSSGSGHGLPSASFGHFPSYMGSH